MWLWLSLRPDIWNTLLLVGSFADCTTTNSNNEYEPHWYDMNRNEPTTGHSSNDSHIMRRCLSLRPNIWNHTTRHILFCTLHNKDSDDRRKKRGGSIPGLKETRESRDATTALSKSHHHTVTSSSGAHWIAKDHDDDEDDGWRDDKDATDENGS